MVCVMTFAALGRQIRKASPALLTIAMAMLVAGYATAGLVA